MPYPEYLVAPMREELTTLGVQELRTADAVDQAVKNTAGTLMIVVNSVCGCAAGKARPGVAMALRHQTTPDVLATVFAGADIDATARARDLIVPLLLLQLLVPVIIAAAQATEPLLQASQSPDDLAKWLGFLALYDVVFVLLSVAVFDFLLED